MKMATKWGTGSDEQGLAQLGVAQFDKTVHLLSRPWQWLARSLSVLASMALFWMLGGQCVTCFLTSLQDDQLY